MAEWEPILRKILQHEGVTLDAAGHPVPGKTGYTNHPDDPGGETNYGITIAEARANGWQGPMTELPYMLVRTIYHEKFWRPIMGDAIPDQQIAEEMADTGVNCGVVTVVKFVQRTLNALNLRGTRYPDIKADGVMGPGTIAALKAAIAYKADFRLAILRTLDSLQNTRYLELTEQPPPRGPKFESFFEGWVLNRCGVAD